MASTFSLDELETSVAKMAKITRCMSPSFSPDGSRIAFISDLNGIPQVWIVATEGGWPELVTALNDQISGVSWSPDGSWLAFSLAPGGGMNTQVYVIRPDGTGLRRLTDGGEVNNWPGPWTHDGSKLAIASNRRSADAMDAYLVDVTNGEFHLAAENKGIGNLTDISRNGQKAILSRMLNRSDDNLFLVDLASGAEVLLTPHEGPGAFGDGYFSPDGQTIYLSSNKNREMIAFARIKLDENGQPGPIEVVAERGDAELQSFDINEDGTTAALIWNVAGRSELAFIDLVTLEEIEGPELPAEIISSATWSKDGRLVALNVAGATAPWDIWVLERATGHLWQATHSSHAGVVLADLVRPELVHFRAHDQLQLSGWLYRPHNFTAPGPIVLYFHGGPESQERPFFNYYLQALLAQGIAIFAPNVRGSTGFGKTFVNLDNGPLRVNAIRDIQSCADYVISSGVADPGRIGIMGGSYGGYMTMAGLTEFPELFAAGANLFGIVNFETFFAHSVPWMGAVSKIEYGDPETQADMLRELSPIHKIDRVKAPTVVLHGANDTNVPVIEAEQTVENLQRRGVPVEYVLFPDEGHGFSRLPNRIRAVVSIVRWFVQHLTR
ncbi:MAG TPA: S9 family peptidase [Ktedonobacteraceae bacterium]|nr:S9 family peptidase [Ktedonobacteraceae bacterium]